MTLGKCEDVAASWLCHRFYKTYISVAFTDIAKEGITSTICSFSGMMPGLSYIFKKHYS